MASSRLAEAGCSDEEEDGEEEDGEEGASAAEAGRVPTAVRLPSTRSPARPRCLSLLRLTEVPFVVPARWGWNRWHGTTAV
jgi:hypothetical protein